jgi:predicted transcriptional regulator with HTH domain
MYNGIVAKTVWGGNGMERWQKVIREKYGYDISYSLERSPLRVKVLLCFFNQQSSLTLSEVSRNLSIDYSNIKGIITGKGGKYKEERALVGLGILILEKSLDGIDRYRLSQKGYEIAKILKEEYYHIIVNQKQSCEV